LSLTIVSVTGDDKMGAEVHLHEAVEQAKGRGLTPRGQLLKGNAEDEILKFTDENKMDLIVMGAYGHTRIREFILGSTTSHVIRKSRVPVLLTR